MATIQAKIVNGNKYWYLVESKRINGKPRPVVLKYLGKPEDILSKLKGEALKFKIKSYSHGSVFALLKMADELEIANIIDKYAPKTKYGQVSKRDGLSVGRSLTIAAINRACEPTSKRGFAKWASTTSLSLTLGSNFNRLDSAHFWDQMSVLDEDALEAIEEAIVKKVHEQYRFDTNTVFYDTTNFYTFIDSANKRSTLAKRGRNKQKRFDLRQLGLALLVSQKEQVPLFSKLYCGDTHDTLVFGDVFSLLTQRLKKIESLKSITLVYDKGNNSKKNQACVDNSSCHYVASLSPAHFPKIIYEANNNFSSLTLEEKKLSVFRKKASVWGSKRTLVVFTSSVLKEGQIRGLHQHLNKALSELKNLDEKLKRKKHRLTKEKLEFMLENLLKGQHLKEVVKYEISKDDDNWPLLEFRTDEKAILKLENEVFGRRILMTDNHHWTTEEIIKAYRGQSHVEEAFRSLKDPYHLAFTPQFHFTDQKLRVHAFICVIAYLLARLIFMKAKKEINYQSNLHNLLDDLSKIRLTMIAEKKEGKAGRPRVTFQLEQVDSHLNKLIKAFSITDSAIKNSSWCIHSARG